MNTLASEEELIKTVPITVRQLRKLRRAGKIPYVPVNRFARLYNIDAVVAALEALEVKANGKTAAK
jgi:hypothetical protein